MSRLFNRREINMITDDLKTFLSAAKGPIDKLDYFTGKAPDLERYGAIELGYRFEHIDIIPEVENAVIRQVEEAEEKGIGIQLHLSAASLVVDTDRLFFQQIFFRLFSTLLEANEKKAVVSVYVTDSDGKCIIEAISQPEGSPVKGSDDYFKKYRITNVYQMISEQEDALLSVYKLLLEEIGGELFYAFAKGKSNYFRLKFNIA
jgi:K+-sensing histidine kinase KdpD